MAVLVNCTESCQLSDIEAEGRFTMLIDKSAVKVSPSFTKWWGAPAKTRIMRFPIVSIHNFGLPVRSLFAVK